MAVISTVQRDYIHGDAMADRPNQKKAPLTEDECARYLARGRNDKDLQHRDPSEYQLHVESLSLADIEEKLRRLTRKHEEYSNYQARIPETEPDRPRRKRKRTPKHSSRPDPRELRTGPDRTKNKTGRRHCVCQEYYKEGEFMLECEGPCKEWYHPRCMGLNADDLARLENKAYICKQCTKRELDAGRQSSSDSGRHRKKRKKDKRGGRKKKRKSRMTEEDTRDDSDDDLAKKIREVERSLKQAKDERELKKREEDIRLRLTEEFEEKFQAKVKQMQQESKHKEAIMREDHRKKMKTQHFTTMNRLTSKHKNELASKDEEIERLKRELLQQDKQASDLITKTKIKYKEKTNNAVEKLQKTQTQLTETEKSNRGLITQLQTLEEKASKERERLEDQRMQDAERLRRKIERLKKNKERLEELQKELNTAKKKIAELTTRMRRDADKAQQRIIGAERVSLKAESELAEIRKTSKTWEKQYQSEKEKLGRSKEAVKKMRESVKSKEHQLKRQKLAYEELRKKLSDTEGKFMNSDLMLNDLKPKLKRAEAKVDEQSGQISQKEKQVGEMQRKIESLSKINEAQKTKIKEYEERAPSLKRRKAASANRSAKRQRNDDSTILTPEATQSPFSHANNERVPIWKEKCRALGVTKHKTASPSPSPRSKSTSNKASALDPDPDTPLAMLAKPNNNHTRRSAWSQTHTTRSTVTSPLPDTSTEPPSLRRKPLSQPAKTANAASKPSSKSSKSKSALTSKASTKLKSRGSASPKPTKRDDSPILPSKPKKRKPGRPPGSKNKVPSSQKPGRGKQPKRSAKQKAPPKPPKAHKPVNPKPKSDPITTARPRGRSRRSTAESKAMFTNVAPGAAHKVIRVLSLNPKLESPVNALTDSDERTISIDGITITEVTQSTDPTGPDVDSDGNERVCRICHTPGQMVCCEGCPAAYHPTCFRSRLSGKLLDSTRSWYCQHCTKEAYIAKMKMAKNTAKRQELIKKACHWRDMLLTMSGDEVRHYKRMRRTEPGETP